MKRIVILAAWLLATGTVWAQEQPVIGIIDLEAALFNSDAARVLEEQTRTDFNNDEQRLERLNAELRELIERVQRDESIMSEAEMRDANAEAQDKQVQMQVIAERLQEAWGQRQQQFIDRMRQSLGEAIDAVVQEGNYDLVLNAEAVAYFNNSYNITAQVTAKLNELAP